MTRPEQSGAGLGYLRGIMVVVALVLPTLSLAVLGTIWLWQNNSLLIWSVSASAAAVLIYSLERWLVSRGTRNVAMREQIKQAASPSSAPADDTSTNSYGHSDLERAAWARVEKTASELDPAKLTTRAELFDLGTRTIEAVAEEMHPGVKNPLWKFTVPEALTLVGRVSDQLNRFVVDTIPLGDRLTVGQMLTVYRWRGVVTVAEKAYDLWRILRFANPAAALTGELREKLSGHLIEGMRTEFIRKLAQAYVREIGRAAIDLYSGRLDPTLGAALAAEELDADIVPKQPVRLLILGQTGVGKSSLLNALCGEVSAAVNVVPTANAFTHHIIDREGTPAIRLVDSPGLPESAASSDTFLDEVSRADGIIWVLSATRPDRSADVRLIREFRALLAANIKRQMPPFLFVLSHIDRVRPFNAWDPPYDIADPQSEKARSIRAAIDAVAEDIAIADADIVPVMTSEANEPYNVDVVWSEITERLPAARNTQLIRMLDEHARSGTNWRTLLKQATNAGRVIGSSLWRPKKKPSPTSGET